MSTYRAKIINLECPITRRFALGTVGASLIALLTGCTESVDSSSTAFDPYGADQVYPALSDIVRFGTYPQGAEEPEPIEWLVLEERDSKTLLLAKRALDYKSYDNEGGDVTWESCTLRSWLNSDFLSQAFTKRELECVVETRIVNADNEKCGTDGGVDTLDRVFLLSTEDVEMYFGVGFVEFGVGSIEIPESSDDLVCFPTDYAFENGTYVDDKNKGCCWWLRSPGASPSDAAYVSRDSVSYGGFNVGNDRIAVRPALWVSDL